MTRKIFHPENESAWLALRALDVTSTESSALFGMSPYATAFELWHRKHDKLVVEIEAAGRMLWGVRLQDVIAKGVAEDYGVKVRRMSAYIRIPEARMGSSFDFEIVGHQMTGDVLASESLRAMYEKHGAGNMEIKNVDALIFRDQWHDEDGTGLTGPEHIELQIAHQMHVSGRKWCALVVLVGGNTPKVIVREYDPEVGAAIEAKVRQFWSDVDAGREPPPVYPEDAAFVASLYRYAEPGKVFDGRSDAELATLCAEYHQAAQREKLAKEDKDVAKAKLLARIGDAEKALVEGFSVSAGLVGPCEVAYTRDGYRSFRLTAKKSTTNQAKEAVPA